MRFLDASSNISSGSSVPSMCTCNSALGMRSIKPFTEPPGLPIIIHRQSSRAFVVATSLHMQECGMRSLLYLVLAMAASAILLTILPNTTVLAQTNPCEGVSDNYIAYSDPALFARRKAEWLACI